jgi:hypothetical protein
MPSRCSCRLRSRSFHVLEASFTNFFPATSISSRPSSRMPSRSSSGRRSSFLSCP